MLAEAGVVGGTVFIPPPGSPGAVRAAADGLAGLADRSVAVAGAVRRGRDDVLGSWSGAAADAFAGYAGELVTLGDAPAEPLESVRRLLHRYADALDTAQRRILAAADRHAAAVAAGERVHPQAELAGEAERDARAAWGAYDSECAAVVAALDRVAEEVAGFIAASGVTRVLRERAPSDARSGAVGAGGERADSGASWQGVQVALRDLQAVRGNAFGWVGYLKWYEKGAGSFVEQGRAWAASDDIWRAAQEAMDGTNWNRLVSTGLAADEMSPLMAGLSKTASVGRILGPLGVATGFFQGVRDLAAGDGVRGAYGLTASGFGMTALVTPPPVSLVCGAAALGMVGGQVLYDNVPAVQDFVDGGVDAVQDLASDAGDVLSDGWASVTDIF